MVGGYAMMVVSLDGCSYFETLNLPADTRIQLTGADGELHLSRREVRNYTCVGDLILHCHDLGEDLACGCVQP